MAGNYFTRKAEKEDIGDIFKMITSNALYHKMPSEIITVSAEELADYLSKGWYQCILLIYEHEENKDIVGFAIFNYCFSSWSGPMVFLEDFYILTDHRGRGNGFRLIQNVAQLARKNGCLGMRWTVAKWNEVAKKLYDKIKAINVTKDEELQLMELIGHDFMNLAQGECSGRVSNKLE